MGHEVCLEYSTWARSPMAVSRLSLTKILSRGEMRGDFRPSPPHKMIVSISEDCHPGSRIWTFDRLGKKTQSLINSRTKVARIEFLLCSSFAPAARDTNVHKDLVSSEKDTKVNV